jgi:hypothetical protein
MLSATNMASLVCDLVGLEVVGLQVSGSNSEDVAFDIRLHTDNLAVTFI